MYYINDGVYGSFNCIMFDHQIIHPYPLSISHIPTTAVPSFPPPPNVHLPVDLPVQLGYKDTEKSFRLGPDLRLYRLCAVGGSSAEDGSWGLDRMGGDGCLYPLCSEHLQRVSNECLVWDGSTDWAGLSSPLCSGLLVGRLRTLSRLVLSSTRSLVQVDDFDYSPLEHKVLRPAASKQNRPRKLAEI